MYLDNALSLSKSSEMKNSSTRDKIIITNHERISRDTHTGDA